MRAACGAAALFPSPLRRGTVGLPFRQSRMTVAFEFAPA
jgi:hypothetical protein